MKLNTTINISRKNATTFVIGGMLFSLLSGCASLDTAITKRNVAASTKMSDTIFLDPAEPGERVVYVQIRNTSDNSGFDIEQNIKDAIQNKGYKITNSPKSAHYILQANVLQAGESTKEQANGLLSSGYGGALTGGAAGAALGSLSNKQHSGLIGGLAGAAVGFAADALIKDKLYAATIDVQLSERAAKGVKVSEHNEAHLHQGNSGYKQVTSNESTDLHKYQTRIQSVAEKMNLTPEEATPFLIAGITKSISGIF